MKTGPLWETSSPTSESFGYGYDYARSRGRRDGVKSGIHCYSTSSTGGWVGLASAGIGL